jgi:hypothetical protein
VRAIIDPQSLLENHVSGTLTDEFDLTSHNSSLTTRHQKAIVQKISISGEAPKNSMGQFDPMAQTF